MKKPISITLLFFVFAALLTKVAFAFDYWYWPDGRRVLVVQSNEQIDLTSLKSGVKGQVTDQRFRTNEAMYLANEIYLSGTEFFLRASEEKLPIAHDMQFSYITNVEAYWYSRYNLMALTAQSRAGIGMIHGPYLDMKAKLASEQNFFGRDHGELALSNKDVMFTQVAAAYLKRTGLPRTFGSAVPLMLEFSEADPHLGSPLNIDNDDTGRAAYLNDFDKMWWSNDSMDKTIDMGGVAQTLLKKVFWAKFFLRRNHIDDDFPGQVFLGNNAADGFRGAMLTLESVSTMLMVKAGLFYDARNKGSGFLGTDGKKLTGINPVTYKPADGLRYIPHKIWPRLIYMGDLPIRQQDLFVEDPSSKLWDQASWLWAMAEFFHFANPRIKDNADRVFGYQTPVDGSLMEQKYALLARGLANTVLANLEAMHLVGGTLVSSWTPEDGPGAVVNTADISLALIGLDAYAKYMDLEPDKQARARGIARQQADFLLNVAASDGSYTQRYQVVNGSSEGTRDATSQAFAIRGLLVAYNATGDSRYLEAARKTSKTWNEDFWDDNAWLYRNEPGNDHVIYSPRDVAAMLSAQREMILVDKDSALLERFKRFFVQSVDVSGLQQSEDIFTGENIELIRQGNLDSDGDGIPFISGGDGAHGIASVFASQVEFDLSKSFEQLASSNVTSTKPSTGKEIYSKNCAVCHAAEGIGNEGPRLVNNSFVQLTGKKSVVQTVSNGRLSVGMPAWGGILADDEISKVVDYIRSLR